MRVKPSRVANDRPCNRCAVAYHTRSLRRPPARRTEPPRDLRHPARTEPRPPISRPRVETPSVTSGPGTRVAAEVRHRSIAGGTTGGRPGSSGDQSRGGVCMKLRHLGAFTAIAALAFSACNQPGASGGTGGTKGTVYFAIELPQQGSEKAASDPII